MSQWDFVTLAYGVVALATVGLIAYSWLAMRRSEAGADAVTRKP
jgi:hypothetical protein